MTENFDVGEVDPDLVENDENQTVVGEGGDGNSRARARARVSRLRLCPERMREYIPCLDNEEAIKNLESTEKGEKYERHCPEQGKGLNCLVPPPKDYKQPIPWPRSRDEVIFSFSFFSIFFRIIDFFSVSSSSSSSSSNIHIRLIEF